MLAQDPPSYKSFGAFPASSKAYGSVVPFVLSGKGDIDILADKASGRQKWFAGIDVHDQRIQKFTRRRGESSSTFSNSSANPSDGMIIFESSTTGTIWEIHSSVLIPDSELLARIYYFGTQELHTQSDAVDPCKFVRGLGRLDSRRFRLTEAADQDFESFLQGIKPRFGQKNTLHRLCSMLVLASDWEFMDLRNTVIQTLTAHQTNPSTPFSEKLRELELLKLAIRAHVPHWVSSAYVHFATRVAPLSAEDAQVAGPAGSAAITRAREQILQRRLGLVASATPPAWMAGWAYHWSCWSAMVEGWKATLNDRNAVRPRHALLEELRRQRASRPATHKLCDKCMQQAEKGKLVEWLRLSDDDTTALAGLITDLGDDLGGWIDKK